MPPASVPAKTDYRPDIDGLRAIAVLSVLAFHYAAPFPVEWRLAGGFTGVDVFFVISGFLITSKLNDDILEGRFSILGFYDRRIRRILPALLVMLAITLFAGKFLLMPGDYKSLATSTAAATFGVSNFFFLENTSYFDQAADLLPLLHTWSLAVEEQFYFVWPLLLAVIAKRRNMSNIAATLGAIVAIGFGISLVWFDVNSKSAFFMAPPRAWELAMGAVLVFLPPLSRGWGEVATVLGLALIGAGFLLVSERSFPGAAALYPCIGAALVIWPRNTSTLTGSWLGYLSPIGLISYSLYLWHWPVWVMYRIYINNGMPRIREAAALAAVSIALATLSYFFVEKPFRKRRWLPAQSVRAGLLACALTFCASMYVSSKEGMPERVPNAYDLRSLDAMWAWTCPRYMPMGELQVVCNFGAEWNSARKRYLLWGDSHAEHMAPLLAAILKPEDGVAVALYARCPAYINAFLHARSVLQNYNENCSGYYQVAMKAIQKGEFTGVIFAGFWSGQLLSLYDDQTAPGTREAGLKLTEAGLLRVIDDIGAAASITLIADVPEFDRDPIPCAAVGALLRSSCPPPVITRQDFDSRQADVYKALESVAAQRPSVNLVLPASGMCDGVNCLTNLDGLFLYRDQNHIRRNLPASTQAELAKIIGLSHVIGR
jgi:peptidoglycan/LPS O-acetylase OafA/YrhL